MMSAPDPVLTEHHPLAEAIPEHAWTATPDHVNRRVTEYLDCPAVPEQVPDGEGTRWFGTNTDITEQKKEVIERKRLATTVENTSGQRADA